jgi:DNA-binding NarL/FixJ family response regulator
MMSPDQIPGTEQCSRPSEAVAEKTRVLLADDNTAVLSHVSDFLAKDFHIVAAVTDGESALRTYHERRPDLLILDISMGKIGGLEVARLLRKSGSQLPIVFLTVHQESDFVHAALASGGSAYVVKSHLANDLVPAIRAALSGELFISPCLLHHLS